MRLASRGLATPDIVRKAVGSKIIHIILIANINGPLLIFVIARKSVQNTNLHLEIERSGLGAKLNAIKSQIEEKIKIKQ